MHHLFHKYQLPLKIILTVVTIVIFIGFWNGSQSGRGGIGTNNKVASVYGQNITQTDIERDVRMFSVAMDLGLKDLIQSLSGSAETQQQALENFVWNSYVFDHEADALQIFPTDAEVQDELTRVPAFQTDGQFDPEKLKEFVRDRLPARGFTDSVIDDLVRKQVRIRKVIALIGSTVDLTKAEMKNRYNVENEKMNISVIRLQESDIEKGINISDADAKKDYDQHKDLYHSEELRKVTVAAFQLSDAQKSLKGKERIDALQLLGNGASNMFQAVSSKGADFNALAKANGAELLVSGLFSASQPDPTLPNVPAVMAAAFKLTADSPNSDILEAQGGSGYYIVHLEKVVPSQQLSFEQARTRIISELKKQQAAQLMQSKATALRDAVQMYLKAGKSFHEAVFDAGAHEEDIPPFSLTEASKLDVPDKMAIIQTAISLSDGQLSDFAETATGGIFVYMSSRETPNSPKDLITQAIQRSSFAHQKQVFSFYEWLRLRKEAAHLQFVQRSS